MIVDGLECEQAVRKYIRIMLLSEEYILSDNDWKCIFTRFTELVSAKRSNIAQSLGIYFRLGSFFDNVDLIYEGKKNSLTIYSFLCEIDLSIINALYRT
jgi:hypothetical protein